MSLEYPVRTIFIEAVELRDAGTRSEYLDQACCGDAALRKNVEELLRAHDAAGHFMVARRSDRSSATGEKRPQLVQPGDRIGRYKLLQEVGEGGAGVVYMAEQEEPVRRRVALKIIKLGMDTRSVIARFEAERQALAMMDHPNIAKVLDAGATETGRPYFVMELVRGIKITEYCDRNNLSTDKRLKLFVQVCRAVQHAHQKGVIHRDLKPGNILVTGQDGVPMPKVIDFGIAKATGRERLTDKTVFTAFDQFIGTPAYMSPEQAEMSAVDIDTRSDIYSLGVLLYELLTGKTPFDPKELLAAGWDEMRRTIREKEPALPSTRLALMVGPELTTVTTHRQTPAPRLVNLLRGELDWVVMKCLEKDRNRRYGTAIEMASDLERYIRNEPVTARPASRTYQFRKCVGRNRIAFAGATAVTVAILVGSVLSTWLYIRERAALNVAAGHAKREKQARIRAEIERAELLFAENDSSRAMVHLARILREQPDNMIVAERLRSALTYRSFCLPAAPPLTHGPPLKPNQTWNDDASRHPLITSDSIRCAQFSPDGKLVLTASRDGTAVLWDSNSGQSILPLRYPDEVFWAEFSPEGDRVIIACRDGGAYIRSVATGELLAPPLRHNGPVTYAEFSPDGESAVTASEDGTARIWNVASGEMLAGPLQHSDTVVTAHFSSNGQWIVTASYDFSARVWDVRTGQPQTHPLRQTSPLFFANFSPDSGKIVAGGNFALWKASGELIRDVPVRSANAHAAIFSAGGNIALVADDYNKVRFWNLDQGIEIRSLQHSGPVRSLALSPDGKSFASGSGDSTARIWDLDSGSLIAEPLKHSSPIVFVSFSPDGKRLVTASQANEVLIWEVRTRGSAILELPQYAHLLRSGRFSPDSAQVLIGGRANVAKLWDVQSGQLSGDFSPDSRRITFVEFSPDGELLVTATEGGVAKMWDRKTHEARAVFRHPDAIQRGGFSQDGKLVFTVSNDAVKVWNATSGDLRLSLDAGVVLMAGFSPDGRRIVTGSKSGIAQIWDTHSGLRVGEALKHNDQIDFVQYSGDGGRILTASRDGTARIWDPETGEPVVPPLQHDDAVKAAVFNFDGTMVVTVSGNSARVWESRTGRPSTDLLRHKAGVNSARFSPDGRYIVTSSDDTTARIWDSATGFPISEPLRHSSAVPYAEFSPDGKLILTIDQSSFAKIWEAPLRVHAEAAPAWLPALAEAVAGQRLNAQGEFQQVSRSELWKTRQTLLQEPADHAYGTWIRWLVSSSATRALSPFSFVTKEENLRQIHARDSLRRGEAHFRNRQWSNALAEFNASLALLPNDVDALMSRGQTYERLGLFAQAEADARRAVALRPNDFWFHGILAFYLSEYARAPDKALPVAEKAVALSDGNYHALNTLGIVQYRLGQYKEAAETLESAARAYQPDSLAAREFFFLAMIWHKMGNHLKAEEYYRKAMEWVRDHPRAWYGELSTSEEVKSFRVEAEDLLGKSIGAEE